MGLLYRGIMDKAPLMEFIHGMDSRYSTDLVDDMIANLTDEQFHDCIGRMFDRICEEEGDVEYTISSTIENVLFDIESSYYDDESEVSIKDIAYGIKDRFYFVKALFAADLTDDAVDFCRRIAKGLDIVSADPKYAGTKELLSVLRDDLPNLIEKDECEKWFNY